MTTRRGIRRLLARFRRPAAELQPTTEVAPSSSYAITVGNLLADRTPLQRHAERIVAPCFPDRGRHRVRPGDLSWYERRLLTQVERMETIQLPVLVVA